MIKSEKRKLLHDFKIITNPTYCFTERFLLMFCLFEVFRCKSNKSINLRNQLQI